MSHIEDLNNLALVLYEIVIIDFEKDQNGDPPMSDQARHSGQGIQTGVMVTKVLVKTRLAIILLKREGLA